MDLSVCVGVVILELALCGPRLVTLIGSFVDAWAVFVPLWLLSLGESAVHAPVSSHEG